MMVGSPLSMFNTPTLAAAPAKGWPLIQRWVSLTSQLPPTEAKRECQDLRLRLGVLLAGQEDAEPLLSVLGEYEPQQLFSRIQGMDGTQDVWLVNRCLDEEGQDLLKESIQSLETYLSVTEKSSEPREASSASSAFFNAEEIPDETNRLFRDTLRFFQRLLSDSSDATQPRYKEWRAEIQGSYQHVRRLIDNVRSVKLRPFNFRIAPYQKTIEAYQRLLETIDKARAAGFTKDSWVELRKDFIEWAGTISDKARDQATRFMRSSGPES